MKEQIKRIVNSLSLKIVQMNRTNSIVKIFLLNMILTLNYRLYAQDVKNSTSLISVKASIIAEGTPKFSSDSDYYFAMTSITNTQDTTINFWIMTCSWPVDNWIVEGDSIYFKFYGCDNNFPIEITLLPNKSINFYGAFITRIKQAVKSKYFRIGFLYFSSLIEIKGYLAEKSKRNSVEKYWSNRIKLEDNLFKYEVE